MWSGWCSYLSVLQTRVELKIDYSKFAHYQATAITADRALMHEKFCIVSDRPGVR